MSWWRRQSEAAKSVDPWRWIFALGIGVLALVAIFIKLEYPANWWLESATTANAEREQKSWVPWLGNGSGLIAAVTAALAPIKGGFSKHTAEIELASVREQANATERLQEAASTIFAIVAESEPDVVRAIVLWRRMTVRIMVVDSSSDPEKLTIVAESRNHPRTTSGTDWVVGKGVVGIAWRDRDSIYRDLQSSNYLAALQSKVSWEAAEPELTQNLTFEEASRLARQDYGAVFAFVAVDGRTVHGLASIDVPPGYVSLLTTPPVASNVQRIVNFSGPELRTLWAARQADARVTTQS